MLNFTAILEIEGKPEPNSWKDGNGNERLSYKINVSQNEGRDVATLGCDAKIYNALKRHDIVTAELTYSEGTNDRGKYSSLKLVSVAPFAPGSDGRK